MMDKPAFLNSLCEIIDLPSGSLTGSENLKDLEQWNSLAIMSYMALADDSYGIALSPAKLRECQTVDDLFTLLEPKV